MGGVVAFELTRHLQKKNRTVPQCLFVSGSKPPHARLVPSQPGRRSVSLLPDAEFIAELRKLNGTPPELLEDIRTLNFFLPRLRADFAVIETAEYELGSTVSCPISAFCGSNDNIAPLPSMMLWKDLTRGTFDYQLIPGDHFFLLRSRPRLLNALIPKLEQLSSSVLFC
jgi:medium-chain acyl-[acyl-carrier-protein] hydrolase